MGMKREPNFAFLLAGIAMFLILGPVTQDIFGSTDAFLLNIMFSAMLIISIWSLQENMYVFVGGTALALLTLVLTVSDWFMNSQTQNLLSMFIILMFEALSMWLAARHLFAAGPISANRLMGGISVFLLMGLSWTMLYVLAFLLNPKALAGALVTDPGALYWDLTYFSFVTLTTLGYGDIQPVTPLARTLAYLEAIAGQLYVAILIGALVGSFIREGVHRSHQD